MIRLPMLLSMALLAKFTLPAWGESEDNPPFSQEDLDFITAAYNLSLDQINLADMAEKAGGEKSRFLADKIAPEHRKIDTTLRGLARRKVGSAIAVPLSGQHPATDALRGKSGALFDRAYIAAAREGKRKDITLFYKEAAAGHSHMLRRFADSELPALRSNLELLRKNRN